MGYVNRKVGVFRTPRVDELELESIVHHYAKLAILKNDMI